MKKFLTVLCLGVLIGALSICSVSAYILPKGTGVSFEEGVDFGTLVATEVYGYVGDADFNGKVNIRDATAIQKSVANISELSADGEKLSDVDFSGAVNVRDATAIQKWIAGIKVSAPVYHALYATDDEAQVECLLGDWVGALNIAEELNAQLNSEGLENLTFERVEVTVLLSFNEDGTYTVKTDQDSIDDTITQFKSEYSRAMTAYFEAFIKENKLATTVEEMLKLSGFNSMDELVDETVPEEEIIDALSAVYEEGRYVVNGNGIYISDSIDTEAQISKNGIYYDYSDTNLVIVTTSGLIGDTLLPAEFVKVK